MNASKCRNHFSVIIPGYKSAVTDFSIFIWQSPAMEQFSFPLVSKESLRDYHFVNHEVLDTITEIESRRFLLNAALVLGNGEKQKVKMVFETTTGPVMVETTIWETTESHIELKGGMDIPICCIREVII